jgi:pantoate--beta-alanine ligase
VVKRLFDIIQPHLAYFGEKDFQQLAIIKALVKKLGLPVQIVPCPTKREASGLAMSSRNERLKPADRLTAAGIYSAMMEAKAKVPQISPRECETFVIKRISELPGIEAEYFSLVNAESLLPVEEWESGKPVVGCVAALIGGVRLIDNMLFF